MIGGWTLWERNPAERVEEGIEGNWDPTAECWGAGNVLPNCKEGNNEESDDCEVGGGNVAEDAKFERVKGLAGDPGGAIDPRPANELPKFRDDETTGETNIELEDEPKPRFDRLDVIPLKESDWELNPSCYNK